jgi:hypothetical protein
MKRIGIFHAEALVGYINSNETVRNGGFSVLGRWLE